MAVRDDRSDVKQTTAGFRDPRHHICQKQIPIPYCLNEKSRHNPQVLFTTIVDFCDSYSIPRHFNWYHRPPL